MRNFLSVVTLLICTTSLGAEVCGVPTKIGKSNNEIYYIEYNDEVKYYIEDKETSLLIAAIANELKVCLKSTSSGFWKMTSIEK